MERPPSRLDLGGRTVRGELAGRQGPQRAVRSPGAVLALAVGPEHLGHSRLAPPARFERATYGLGIRRSVLLSYGGAPGRRVSPAPREGVNC